jgi:hypothetical protein
MGGRDKAIRDAALEVRDGSRPAQRVAHLVGAVETGHAFLAENSRREVRISLLRGALRRQSGSTPSA